MSQVKIYFDQRRIKNDGTFPIKFRVHHHSVFYVQTEFTATEKEFINNQFTACANNAKVKNIVLRRQLNKIERFLLDVDDKHQNNLLSDKEVKVKIEKLLSERDVDERLFVDVMEEKKELCRAKNTRDAYQQTIDKILFFSPDLSFSTLTVQWLRSFEEYMIKDGLSVNSRSIHLRNIRASLNYAIDNDETDIYPFKRFQIKKEETAHRCMSEEQLRNFIHAELEDYQVPYYDIFLFMLYTIGLNPVDLFNNKSIKVVRDRLIYSRAKTGKLYSIKLEPESKHILDKYNGLDGLISLADGDYRTFMAAMNRGLKRISVCLPDRVGKGGRKIYHEVCQDLTAYYARHTWATVASSLGISLDDISEALGHEYGCKTTHIYVKFDRNKVDIANRKVIDYINSL